MEKLVLLGDINVNCYIITNKNKCYIIDPGYEKEKIRQYIDDKNLDVEGILLTHGHLDHIGAVDCFDVPIYLFEDEFELFSNNNINGYNELGIENKLDYSKLNIVKFDKDFKLFLGDKEVEIIFTPGHTKGGVCYKYENEIFTGDTLFKGSVGRHDFPTGDVELLKESVVRLIESNDDSINIHPGHMESSTIGNEKENNPHYLMWK